MILDTELELSTDQAVTAAAASENIIDLGVARDIGVGEELYVVGVVKVAMTDASSDSTLEVKLQTDDNAAFSSATDVQTLFTFPATSAAGTLLFAKIDPADHEQFLRGYYTPANGNLTTGTFDLFLTKDIQKQREYASGFTIA